MKTRSGPARAPRVLIGVTSYVSLVLLGTIPAKLSERGLDVHVVASGAASEQSMPGLAGATLHDVSMARQPSPLQDLMSFVRMLRLIRRINPEVVVMGTPKAGLLGLLAARFQGVPERVYHVRGLRMETETGVRCKVLRALEQVALASSTRVVAVSESLKQELGSLGGRGTSAVVLGQGSSKGVDTERFVPLTSEDERRAAKAAIGVDPDTTLIGFVGRLTRDKGILDLLQASDRLIQNGSPHQLLLVGAGEDAAVEEQVQRRVRAGQAVQLGHAEQVEDFYAAMEVFCLPTLREGFPNVVLEASSSGLPVVTTTATGAVDSVVDGETGIAVPPRDSEALAGALRGLIENPADRARLGVGGRSRVLKNFRKEDVEGRFVDYVRRVASSVATEAGTSAKERNE